MKILIVNAYLRNNGDAALLSVLISQLRGEWPDAEIVISSREDPTEYPSFEGCENIGSLRMYTESITIARPTRIFRKAVVQMIEMIWPLLGSRPRALFIRSLPKYLSQELSAINTADIVISTGGGYINGTDSIGGNLNIKYALLPMKLAEKIHKMVVFGPQSYGPLGNDYQRKLVKKVVNASKCTLVREDKSMDLLTSIGVNDHVLRRAVDSGFAFENEVNGRHGASKNPKISIGMTARLWFSKKRQKEYEQALAGFITSAADTYHAETHLIAQASGGLYAEDDDRYVEREIAKFVRESGYEVDQIDAQLNHHELKQVYNTLDYTIGTRFHSVIFSLTSYVPAIAIEYEHKTSGIMKDLGLSKWVIKIDDVTEEKLNEMFKLLVKERQQYVDHLHRVLPDYIENARQTGKIIRQIYDESSAKKSADIQ